MLTHSFRGDVEFILEKIKKGQNFALTRTGDGELSIMANRFIDITSKENGEFRFDPSDKTDVFYREELIKSYKYDHEEYYVGISCPCCEKNFKVQWMRKNAGTKNITWANLFVNGNYDYFLENFIPEFKKRDIVMVCNKKSKIEDLPFEVDKSFFVGTNCYKENYKVVEEIKQYISENNIKNNIFILCAGPLSNILAYKLFDDNRKNTYLDCGSVFDPMMGLGRTRGYHRSGYHTKSKICVW